MLYACVAVQPAVVSQFMNQFSVLQKRMKSPITGEMAVSVVAVCLSPAPNQNINRDKLNGDSQRI